MRRAVVAALALALSLAAGRVAEGQRVVVLSNTARTVLAKDWDAHQGEPRQLERAFCVTYSVIEFAEETAYRVDSIEPAKIYESGPNGILFFCALGAHRAALHVHTPQSCYTEAGKCDDGGDYAFQCFPSDTDLRGLDGRGEPFGLIQCDRKAVIAFWPSDTRPPKREP